MASVCEFHLIVVWICHCNCNIETVSDYCTELYR